MLSFDCMKKAFREQDAKFKEQGMEDLASNISEEGFNNMLKTNVNWLFSGALNMNCKEVSAIDLTLPSDVVFVDECLTL